MPAVPTLGVKLHTDTQYGRNQLASWIGVHNLSISDRSILEMHDFERYKKYVHEFKVLENSKNFFYLEKKILYALL